MDHGRITLLKVFLDAYSTVPCMEDACSIEWGIMERGEELAGISFDAA